MTMVYEIADSLYLNLTNKCNNNCEFCVRKSKDGVAGYNLWLEEEPEATAVIAELKNYNLDSYDNIVFCGYGEPLIRLEELIEVAQYIKNNSTTKIRINTNGQANLIHQRNILPLLAELIDIISISLNASTAEKYQEICQPAAGKEAFEEIISFIKEAKKYIFEVNISAVSYPGIDITECEKIAENLDVNFKLRSYN